MLFTYTHIQCVVDAIVTVTSIDVIGFENVIYVKNKMNLSRYLIW